MTWGKEDGPLLFPYGFGQSFPFLRNKAWVKGMGRPKKLLIMGPK